MELQDLKIKCLELASLTKTQISISSDAVSGMQMKSTLNIAQEYYQWVTGIYSPTPIAETKEPTINA